MESVKFLELWQEIRKVFDETIDKYDSKWRTRCRAIGTRFLIIFIMRLVIPKDRRGYGCTLMELFSQFLNSGIENMPQSLAPSSVCEARRKLDPLIFKELNEKIIGNWNQYIEKPHLWHGHRLYGVDGSKFHLPRELLEAGYKTPGDHAHYPQGLVSAVYDLLTGVPHDFDIVNHQNERTCAEKHLQEFFKEGDVVVYDRGYFSFALLEFHVRRGVHPIFRVQFYTLKEIQEFWNSNKTDDIVTLRPPKEFIKSVKTGEINASLDPIKVRLIKYIIKGVTYVLCTTLLDQTKYPEEIFPDVYHSRWGFEEMLKVSKVITGVQDFHAKTELGIKQELFAHFLLITLQKIIESQSLHEVIEEKKVKTPPKRRLRLLNDKNNSENIGSDKKNQLQTIMKGSDELESKIEEPINLLQEASDNVLEQIPSSQTNEDHVHNQAEKVMSRKMDDSFLEKGSCLLEGKFSQFEQQSSKEKDKKIKLNTRNCFLNFGWAIEKLFCLDPIIFLENSVVCLVEAAKRIYQKVRPCRSYPRESRQPESKWRKAKPQSVVRVSS